MIQTNLIEPDAFVHVRTYAKCRLKYVCLPLANRISIAEAQQITVKKAILQGAAPSLVAKLCMDVHNKFKYVEEMITSLGNVGMSVSALISDCITALFCLCLCIIVHIH